VNIEIITMNFQRKSKATKLQEFEDEAKAYSQNSNRSNFSKCAL